MAKQEGLTTLNGKVGDLIYYTNRYGKQVRSAPDISIERIRTAPEFAGRRDASSEFGYSSRMGKLLRVAVRRCFPGVEQGSTHNKLARHILAAVKQDKENARGKRALTAGNVGMLEGFGWKEGAFLSNMLSAGYKVELDTDNRTAILSIDSLVPARDIKTGDGASHVEIVLVAACINYEENKGVEVSARTEMIEVDEKGELSVSLSCTLPDSAGKVFIAGIGVQGYQQVAGKMNALMGGNGFEIVKGVVGI